VVNLVEGQGHPVVWAEGPQIPGKPTVLVYGHYDVQPPDPLNEWATPPFEPTIRDGKLYARGAADDKGQVYCLLKAYEAVRGADGKPPVNVHFIFEGEEECGGRVIFDLLRAEPERTRADAALVCDMSYFAPGWPAVYTALRGLCYAEITVRTLQRDLHSGTYGGAAPNAHETLVRLLSDLKDEDGKIHIKKLYKSVEEPGKAELKSWKQLPFDEEKFLSDEVTAKALTGLDDYSVLERVWALPTFEIHGIKGGFVGEGYRLAAGVVDDDALTLLLPMTAPRPPRPAWRVGTPSMSVKPTQAEAILFSPAVPMQPMATFSPCFFWSFSTVS
jgi:acetylornithine deacetylase/succinyl-diaminopimelate desuccinylase-like protein